MLCVGGCWIGHERHSSHRRCTDRHRRLCRLGRSRADRRCDFAAQLVGIPAAVRRLRSTLLSRLCGQPLLRQRWPTGLRRASGVGRQRQRRRIRRDDDRRARSGRRADLRSACRPRRDRPRPDCAAAGLLCRTQNLSDRRQRPGQHIRDAAKRTGQPDDRHERDQFRVLLSVAQCFRRTTKRHQAVPAERFRRRPLCGDRCRARRLAIARRPPHQPDRRIGAGARLDRSTNRRAERPRHQLHQTYRAIRRCGLGRPHARRQRPGRFTMEVYLGAPPLHLHRAEPVRWNPMGGVRTEQRTALGATSLERRRLHADAVSSGGIPGHGASAGLFRQMRCRKQSAAQHRPGCREYPGRLRPAVSG